VFSQVQCSSMQECLRGAEGAAAVAASECDALVKIVQTLINQDALVRSKQAHRADALRNELQQTHAALRRAADKDRGAQDEVRVPTQHSDPGSGSASNPARPKLTTRCFQR
jgi:hypothetical protein